MCNYCFDSLINVSFIVSSCIEKHKQVLKACTILNLYVLSFFYFMLDKHLNSCLLCGMFRCEH